MEVAVYQYLTRFTHLIINFNSFKAMSDLPPPTLHSPILIEILRDISNVSLALFILNHNIQQIIIKFNADYQPLGCKDKGQYLIITVRLPLCNSQSQTSKRPRGLLPQVCA